MIFPNSRVSRHQQRYIGSTPWSLQTLFYPMSTVEPGAFKLVQAPKVDEGAVAYLYKRGIHASAR